VGALSRAGSEPLSARAHARLAWALWAVLLAVSAVPLFAATYPPLTDYPNHLARMHVLRARDESPALRAMVDVAWRPVPNLAMDLVVPFVPWLPDHAAGRLFVFLCFAALSGGALLLQRALLGRVTLGALFAVPLLFNGILAWGFLGYLMGLGLMLAALALYVSLRPAPPARRVPWTALVALVLYVSHFYAFALYGVAVLVYELDRFARSSARDPLRWARDLGWAASQAAVPALCFALFSPQQGEGPAVAWGSLRAKLYGLAYLTSGLHAAVDHLTLLVLVAAVAFHFGRGTARLLRPAPALLAACGALFLALPGVLLSSTLADRRMVVAIGFLFAAGLAIERVTRRGAAALAGALAAATVLQAGITGWRWAQREAEVRPLREAVARLPLGASLAFAHPPSVAFGPLSRCHLPSLVTLERDGFSPNFFAHRNQQPTALTPAYARLAKAPFGVDLFAELAARARRPDPAWSELFDARLAGYDALLLLFEDAAELPDLASAPLRPVGAGRDFRLYAIERAAPTAHASRPPP